MKRLIILSFCIVGLVLADNLLTNGDFEQPLSTGWTSASYGSNVFIDRATTYDPDGDYEARCEKGDGLGYAQLAQTVDVPTTDLDFSCMAKVYAWDNHTTAWCGAAVRIFYLNSASDILGETMICMRSTQCPWGNTSTRHVIEASDSMWHPYAFNIDDELTNLPGVNPFEIAKMSIALYDTCYDCWGATELAKVFADDVVLDLTVSGVYLTMCDVTIDDQGGNNNGILDPGETVDLTTTLKNIGDITAFNVEGVLSTTSPYVTINSGNPASWGDIAAGDSSESSPWGITADAGAPVGSVVDFELIVNDNGSYCDTLDFDIVIGVVGVDFVTHNCGNVKLSVTRYGALGYMSSAGTHGEGFCFPVSSGSHLFYGGFAAGTNSSYCVDRYYETTNVDDSDWNTTTSPDGMVRLYEPGPGTIDEYTTARYDDSGHSAPKGLVCDQYGWSWDDATADEFVIMVFDMHNEGASAINDLYAAVFMDWDLGSYTSNQGSSDESRNLTWMYENTPYVGVAILDPPRTTQAVNLSMIDHDLYVYPNGGLPDNVQIQFMDGSIQMPSSDRPYDWSTCNSAGPFTINPGESAIAAFAIIGGNSVSAIQANADTAYNRYWGIQDVKELSSSGSVDFLSVYPAISRGKPYSIQYGLNSGKHINVKVYDTAGRLLIDRQYSNLEKTGTINIAFDKFAQGIYFIQITSSNTTKTAKVIWLK